VTARPVAPVIPGSGRGHLRQGKAGADVARRETRLMLGVIGAARTHDMNNFRSGLFVVAIRVGLVRIRVVTLKISISVYTSHGTNSCATLLLALCCRKRFKESRNTPQTIEELSNRQVDDVLERLLACEKGGHTQFEALAV
jgi:hypothetical protein